MSGGDFHTYAFAATGGTASRTMPDRLADIVNVKDYGAVGGGIVDDAAAIQAAVDAAFGTSGSPHGTTATSNRPLFFPNSTYLVGTPIVLTKVRGAHIYGAGQFATTINGTSGVFITNGCDYCNFENIALHGGAGATVFDLDWDGVGSVGLYGNIFTNVTFDSGKFGCRIGFSGNGGKNNQFYGCNFGNTSGAGSAGLVAYGAAALGNTVQGGGASGNVTGYWAKDGQIAAINDSGLAVNTAQDILVDSAFPLLAKGNRTESVLFARLNSTSGVAKLDGNASNPAVASEFCHVKGKVILDSCTANSNVVFCTDNTFTGTVYVRGCPLPAGFLTAFAGITAQNI